MSLEIENNQIKESIQCLKAVAFYERKYRLPKNLLRAISIVESGRFNKEYRAILPWPWTLNVAGKPYFFNTRKEAEAFLRKTIRAGVKNVDVGCAQINFGYHGHYFGRAEELLDPVYNIAYAAHFLVQNYGSKGSWKAATATYHSQRSDLGMNYTNKVEAVLKKLPRNGFAALLDTAVHTQLAPKSITKARLRSNIMVYGQTVSLPSTDESYTRKTDLIPVETS